MAITLREKLEMNVHLLNAAMSQVNAACITNSDKLVEEARNNYISTCEGYIDVLIEVLRYKPKDKVNV